jgi:mono/diheme cytochrome c family protein
MQIFVSNGPVAATEQPDSLSEGGAIYMQSCAACHGAEGRGNGPVAPALVQSPADLTQLSLRNHGLFPRDEIVAIVSGERDVLEHGTREMPVWSQRFGPSSGATGIAAVYARRRLELLIGFLESIQRTSDEPTPSPAP